MFELMSLTDDDFSFTISKSQLGRHSQSRALFLFENHLFNSISFWRHFIFGVFLDTNYRFCQTEHKIEKSFIVNLISVCHLISNSIIFWKEKKSHDKIAHSLAFSV